MYTLFGGRTQSKLNYLKNRKEVNDGNEEIRMGHDPEGRLQCVKDDDRNVVTRYDYHYGSGINN